MMPQIRIATWNLRYDSKPDSVSIQDSIKSLPDPLTEPNGYSNVIGEAPWSTRRIKVAQILISEGVSISGFQEALKRQVTDMLLLLQMNGEPWSFVGVGRKDGKTEGEFCPIFYNESKVQILEHDTFWLSDDPFTPGSKHPKAGSIRICTVARLRLNDALGEPGGVVILNTHLDNDSEEQRQLGASLVLARARYEAAQNRGIIIVTGDFNSSATGDADSGAYKIMTGVKQPVPISSEFAAKYPIPNDREPHFRLLDIRGITDSLSISGNFSTFTDFKSPENSSSETGRIDFIFGGSNGGWTSNAYKVPSVLSDDGVLASDHRPVLASLTVQV